MNVAQLNANCKNNLPTSEIKLPSSWTFTRVFILYIHTCSHYELRSSNKSCESLDEVPAILYKIREVTENELVE